MRQLSGESRVLGSVERQAVRQRRDLHLELIRLLAELFDLERAAPCALSLAYHLGLEGDTLAARCRCSGPSVSSSKLSIARPYLRVNCSPFCFLFFLSFPLYRLRCSLLYLVVDDDSPVRLDVALDLT